MEKLFEIKPEEWKQEIAGIEEFYGKFGERLPKELLKHLAEVKKNFS